LMSQTRRKISLRHSQTTWGFKHLNKTQKTREYFLKCVKMAQGNNIHDVNRTPPEEAVHVYTVITITISHSSPIYTRASEIGYF
jgi:hypothetical protein